MLPLDTNPRAKMLGIEDGFVKIFARRGSGSILGGVVVGPRASELILPITIAWRPPHCRPALGLLRRLSSSAAR
ncbi:NAD(P)H dehydrogenase (quinone) [Brevibacterium casei]|uniref:NAD(P)H dehydrogenase (Quinone) n=2 Tax=Brevibacterium casei TaxID=33889 RepID=A0A449CZ01_9MICO|nr:NAD(P)H dehydrogenase (quinone) [Brevibacterium casei]